jgi:hypothetical protein
MTINYSKKIDQSESTNRAANTFKVAKSYAQNAKQISQDTRYNIRHNDTADMSRTIETIFDDAKRGVSQNNINNKNNISQMPYYDKSCQWKDEAKNIGRKAKDSANRMGALLEKLMTAKDEYNVSVDKKEEQFVDQDLINAFFGSNIETAREVIKSITAANNECEINSIDDFVAYIEQLVLALQEVTNVFNIEIAGLKKI